MERNIVNVLAKALIHIIRQNCLMQKPLPLEVTYYLKEYGWDDPTSEKMISELEELIQQDSSTTTTSEKKYGVDDKVENSQDSNTIPIHEAIELCHRYGQNTTMGEFVRMVQGNKTYKCPHCHGNGLVTGSVCGQKILGGIPCDLCKGEGY